MFGIKSFARVVVLAMMGVFAVAAPAVAQNVIGTYQAYLGYEDLYNSNGGKLTAPWQVIRQDRANFHKFGIQHAGDQWDAFFGDYQNRAALEQWVMNAGMSNAVRNRIMSGGATIDVEILGWGNTANGVRLTVY